MRGPAKRAPSGVRSVLVLLHRWVGLGMAAFLFISGLTGAVISWDHELDEWLNPHLTRARAEGPPLAPLSLAHAVESRYPQVQVTYVPLAVEPGHALALFVEPRVNVATKQLHQPGFNQVFLDPATGDELGKREWGAVWPLSQENFVSFLYVLHYSLHLPAWGGIDRWGVWLMGVVALFWTVDCFTGLYLTLPPRRSGRRGQAVPGTGEASWWRRWAPAWKLRWRVGGHKFNFDLHRAGSLWTWGLLLVVAFTAFSLNLYREVFFPMMSLVSDVTPTPTDQRMPAPPAQPIAAGMSMDTILALARQEASRRNWPEPAGAIGYDRTIGLYSVQFFQPADEHGAGGVGHRELYLDGQDGRLLGDREPWKGTAADLFVQAQFPVHSGRILGLPGRVLISLLGLVVALLSVTGVVIWWRKRVARSRRLTPARGGETARPIGLN